MHQPPQHARGAHIPHAAPQDTRYLLSPFPRSPPPFWQWPLSSKPSPGADPVANPIHSTSVGSAGSEAQQLRRRLPKGKKLRACKGVGGGPVVGGRGKSLAQKGSKQRAVLRTDWSHGDVGGAQLPAARSQRLSFVSISVPGCNPVSGMEMKFQLLGVQLANL